MRIMLPLLAGVAVLSVACSDSPQKPSATPTTAATAAVDQVIDQYPNALVLPPDKMVTGSWKVKEGTIVNTQFNRSWERDAAEAAATGGSQFTTITATLYRSPSDAHVAFINEADPPGGHDYCMAVIQNRGVPLENITCGVAALAPLGTDREIAWRAEFRPMNSPQVYVQYLVFVRVKNTRALITTAAESLGGAENPNLITETTEVAKRQAQYLLSLPISTVPFGTVVRTATP